MAKEPITIPQRPIEAGTYSWGWVDYGDYDSAGRPQLLSVVMLPEPTDRQAVDRLRRIARRPRWLSTALGYGPLVFAYFLLSFGNPAENRIIGPLALILTGLSCWQLWQQSRGAKEIESAVEVSATRSIESYIAGRAFLQALSDPALARDDLFGYFNLRASAEELKVVISDAHY